ncbi:MAG TPA: O-methyltransferase [Thermomicrobiales bacterium]|nr:O-methyltransferase [Thermomicrobiales bacterium]
MTDTRFADVDAYFERIVPTDEALDAAIAASNESGLPPIQVSSHQGKLIQILAKMQGARRILEIGTLGGYSTIWLARALPDDGRLITLELDPHHASVAKANIERASLAQKVEVRVGPALDTMKAMVESREPPFDFIFIDADKPGYPGYLDLSIQLSRPGTAIFADNVVRNGGVADLNSRDPNVIGVRTMIDAMAGNPRLSATGIQTVGSKGYDGFALFLVDAG